MKACIVSSTVFPCPPPGYAGLEMVAYQCAVGLANKGHQVALVAPEGSTFPQGELISCGPPGQWDEKTAYSTFWQRLLEFDVIIDHSWQKWSYILKSEGKLQAPILGVLHAPVNTMYQTLPPVDFSCMVCISEDQAGHFDALHGRQARVVYNGVDGEFYKPLGLQRTKRFLFLARFSSIKGADIAIEACHESGVGLDLIGDTSITHEPEYLAHCQTLTERANQGRSEDTKIIIHGACNRGQTVWWYSQAYCMLHPNRRFREPFGLAPVEAMLCGCPVIAWDYGACKETISPWWRVKTKDQMVQKIKELSRPSENHGYVSKDTTTVDRDSFCKFASNFGISRMVEGYEKLCEQAIGGDLW